MTQVAVILSPDCLDDQQKRDAVVQAVARSSGVLNVDAEMAENGLLLCHISGHAAQEALAHIEGVEGVEGMDVKQVSVAKP